MSQTNDLRTAATSRDTKTEAGDAENTRANMLTLEICFLAVIGLMVVAAFLEALSYKIVSARTPFVIMVPLILLIVVQARRLFVVRHDADFNHRLKMAVTGRMPDLNKVVAKSGWMAGLLVAVVVLGHIAAIAIYSFVLMRLVAKENLKLALIVTVATTLFIYVLFEIGFNVELYRGLIVRYFLGFRDFG
jgi:fatty acid desaturase